MRPVRYLLVKGRAGLGNRILGLLTAILYAQLSHRRLVVDWGDRTYSDDGENVFHRYFVSPWCDPTAEVPPADSVTPAIWRDHLGESVSELAWRFRDTYSKRAFRYASSVDLARIDHSEEIAVFWNFYAPLSALRPHFSGEHERLKRLSSDAILRELLRLGLELRPEIRARVEQFRRDRFAPSMLGVHVRYTDRRARLSGILKKVDAVRRHDRCPIFLATDNTEIHDLFIDRYHDVVSTPHWYAPDGARLHQAQGCPDRFQNGVEALIDLYLLAECAYLVGDSNSSFAKIADLLSSAPASRRYDARLPRVFNVRHGEMVEGAAREAVQALRARLKSRGRH